MQTKNGPTFAISGATLFDGFQIHEASALLVENGVVQSIIPEGAVKSGDHLKLNGGWITPGLIDLQVNGGGGVLLNNAPTETSMLTMAGAHERQGVTRILPTVISDSPSVTEQALAAAKNLIERDAGILGVHIEGPFFSPEKSGVHKSEHIRKLEAKDWDWLQTLSRMPSILTLAPEQVDTSDICRLAELGIRLSAGHSNASYEQTMRGIDAGISGFTHLFNAMSQMAGRNPGVVGAALATPSTWAGLIADGHHVHPASIRAALAAKGCDRIFLVSDCMVTVGSTTNHFELYGETIRVENNCLVNHQGRLAGSAISLLDAVRYCIQELNLSPEISFAMATSTPAQFLGVDANYGSLLPGRSADICWFDENWQLNKVWRSGDQLSISD